jgi:hypothetical protein
MSKRGKYKKYINIEDAPKSTLYSRRKRKHQEQTAISQQEQTATNQQFESTINPIRLSNLSYNQANTSNNTQLDEDYALEEEEEDEDDDNLSNELSAILDDQQKITKDELAAAFLAVFFDSNMTKKALSSFVALSNLISSVKLPKKFDQLRNILFSKQQIENYKPEKTWFCPVCLNTYDRLRDQYARSCPSCKTRLLMFYNVDIKYQVQTILKKFEYSEFGRKSDSSDEMMDITDGQLYKNLLASEDGHLFQNKQAFSFLLNTDGISFCDKSNLQLWPIYLAINELPLEKRYSCDNIILAGLSVGDKKPNFNFFLKKFILNLNDLERGIDVEIENEMKTRKFFVIAGIFDKPARAAILNMKSCTGKFGCTKCLQTGESLKNAAGTGQSRIYPFNDTNPKGPPRTHEKYNIDLNEVKNGKEAENGVLGITMLSFLKYYKPTTSTCIDYMHSLVEGVVANFFNYWFEGERKYSGQHSLRKYMQEVEERLKTIKPPTFIPRPPRSIYDHKQWHANEYLIFIIYYALPVLKNLMIDEYYDNIKKLVIFTEIILDSKININKLKQAEKLIIEFVKELKDLYPPGIMLSGVHELLHLVDETLHFGPLNSICCFPFEELNRKLLTFFKGKDLIGEELFKVYSTVQNLFTFVDNIKNKKILDFVKKILQIKSSNIKKRNNAQLIEFKDKIIESSYSEFISLFKSYTNINLNTFLFCYKIKYNGSILTSYTKSINTKRCDSCFITKNDQIGVIEFFLINENNLYVVGRKIIGMYNQFFPVSFPNLKSQNCLCYLTNEFFIHKLEDIRKITLITVKDKCYYSLFSFSHLFT